MDQLQSVRNPSQTLQAAARAFGLHDWTQAEGLCRQVLLVDPRNADTLHVLALVLNETGRSQDAIPLLRETIAQQPWNAIPWSNLGLIYCDAGDFAEAVNCQRQAIDLQENYPEAHYNLSLAYRGLGQVAGAIAAARRATELRPGYAKAHFHLGNLLYEQEHYQSALAAYQAALQINPDWPDAHLHIAAVWYELAEPAKAAAHCREVLRLDPANRDAEYWMGRALKALGRIAEAKSAYARAALGADGNPCYRDPMSRLFRESLAEVIAPDTASISEYHARLNAALQAFAAEPGTLDLSLLHTRAAAVPDMMLAYYGGNVRPIMEQYARAIGPQIPHSALRPRSGKPKLGIVVTDNHEVVFARCWGGIAELLSRELFDIKLVCSRRGASILQTILKLPDTEYLCLPEAVDAAAEMLHKQEFDWLHYWEIGTDQMNYYLPFFRTAPGQSACWGWPVTSGNLHVNSYLSCGQLEPPEGPSHYSEQLILLKQLPTYYVRPAAPSASLLRSCFGLKDNQHVYLCTQNLRKYHPDFDPLLADLLRSDSLGVLVVIAHAQASITELLMKRLRRTMPEVISRVGVLPRMAQDEYLGLVAAADVVLDTLHYGAGANTVYDAVAVGTPLVTLPGEFHRTRWAAAVNRRLAIDRMIASTPEEYVAKAVEVASDKDLRQSLHQHILQAGAELFEDATVVSEHGAYFSEAIAATRNG